MASHFDEFFRLLPDREDGEHSWTVDIAARRREAKARADKLRAKAAKPLAEAEELTARVKELKKAKRPKKSEIAALEAEAKEMAKEGRELMAKAQSMEDAAFDLKAVNPNRKTEEDKRTPAELLDFIEAKGKEVAEALAELRAK